MSILRSNCLSQYETAALCGWHFTWGANTVGQVFVDRAVYFPLALLQLLLHIIDSGEDSLENNEERYSLQKKRL